MSYRTLGNVLKKVADIPEPLIGVLYDLLEKLNSGRGNVWWEELMKFLRKEPCWVLSLSLKEMIKKTENDWVNENITEANFPMPVGFVLGTDTKLFHFKRDISSEEAIKLMKEEGWRPATVWDLLDYGIKYPKEQLQYPIVALGSVAQIYGNNHVVCLEPLGTIRNLCIGWFMKVWDGRCRFLAVRN